MAYQNYGYHPQQYQNYAYAQQPHPGSYQARIREYEAVRIPQHYAPGYSVPPHYAPNYDPYPTNSSDYISQPKYSKEDHIAPHLPSARSLRPKEDYDATRYSTSDYISPPVENRDDYISPNYDAADLDSSSYDGTDLDSSPEQVYYHSKRERNTEDRYYDPPSPIYHAPSPVQQNSPHRTIKATRFSIRDESQRTHNRDTWDSDSDDEDSNILDGYPSEDDALVARAPSPPTALSPPTRATRALSPPLRITRAPSPPTRHRNYSQPRSVDYDSETYVNDTDDDSAQLVYASDSDVDVRSNVMPGGYASSSPEPQRYASRSPEPRRIAGRYVEASPEPQGRYTERLSEQHRFAEPRRYLSSSSLGNDYTSEAPRISHRYTSSSSTSTPPKPPNRNSRRHTSSSSTQSPSHPSVIHPPPRHRSPFPPDSDSDFEIHGGSDVDSAYTRARSPSAEPGWEDEVRSEDEGDLGGYVGSDVCNDGISGSWD